MCIHVGRMQVFERLIWNQPYVLLFLTVTFWCGNFVVGEYTTKLSPEPVPPVQLAFIRWVCAALVLLPFALRGLRAEMPQIRANLPALWIIGVSAYTFYNTCIYLALSNSSSNATSLATLQTIFPAVVAILALVLFGTRLKWANVAGIVLAVIGGFLATSQGDVQNLLSIRLGAAEWWALGAVLSYASYTVLLRLRPAGISSLPFLWLLIVAGLTVLGPWWAYDTWVVGNRFPINGQTLLALGYLMIFPSLVSALCYNRAIQLIGPNVPSLSINLMPFGIAFLIWLSPLPSQLAWYHLISLAVIFPGIWLVRR